jgi:hypothetical protein
MLEHKVKIPGLEKGAESTVLIPDLKKEYSTVNVPLGQIRFVGKEKWLPELENFVFDYVRPMEQIDETKHNKDNIQDYKENQHVVDKDQFMKKVASGILKTMYRYGAVMNQRGFVYEDKHPTLYKMAMSMGLDDPQILVLKYLPGTCTLIHADQHPGYDMYDPRRKNNNHATKNHGMERVMVQLDDRYTGAWMQFNDTVWNNWKAGDVHIFDERFFHSFGNASNRDRWVLRVTGRATDKFYEFLKQTEIVV